MEHNKQTSKKNKTQKQTKIRKNIKTQTDSSQNLQVCYVFKKCSLALLFFFPDGNLFKGRTLRIETTSTLQQHFSLKTNTSQPKEQECKNDSQRERERKPERESERERDTNGNGTGKRKGKGQLFDKTCIFATVLESFPYHCLFSLCRLL